MEWFESVKPLIPSFIQDYLGPLSIITGIVGIIPIVLTWWEVTVGRKRRQKRWFREIQQAPGDRPAVLIVDLLEKKDIAASVENYRQQSEFLKHIPQGRIFNLERNTHLSPDDMPDLMRDIRDTAANMLKKGVGTLHLFYAGPVVPMASLGAEFSNTFRVILYQHKEGEYENWGPLRHDGEDF